MRVTFGYVGQPKVTLVVGIPKLRTEEIPATRVWKTRGDLLVILNGISGETKANPDSFATELFKQVKEKKQDLHLTSVIFTIIQEDGSETSLCYVKEDINI